jgi:predicted RNA-binding protein YlxR (DUF448 family)/ribosomal protein L7Ae-like RNA K-turn-binding protein
MSKSGMSNSGKSKSGKSKSGKSKSGKSKSGKSDSESGPERTCAGCRRRDARSALLRFVVRADEPRLVPDPRHRLPGRGVSVHPTRACVDKAVTKGGFAKALASGGLASGGRASEGRRSTLALSTDEVCEMAAAQYEQRVDGLLLAAGRNRKVAAGTDAVRHAMTDGQCVLLVVGEDAAGRREELVERATRLAEEGVGLGVVTFADKAKLGRLFGRAELGAVAILDEGIATEVARACAHVTELMKAGAARAAMRGAASAGGSANSTPSSRRNG